MFIALTLAKIYPVIETFYSAYSFPAVSRLFPTLHSQKRECYIKAKQDHYISSKQDLGAGFLTGTLIQMT